MTYEGDVILDFLYEMWAYQYPKAAATMLILWFVYLATDLVCIVDFGWALSHFIIGLTLTLQYTSSVNYRGWVMLGILGFWFITLGGYMFYRFTVGYKEKRYEEMAKGKKHRRLFFFTQYQFQAIVVIFTATPLYFVFRNYEEERVRWNFIVGGLIALAGILGQHTADQQLRLYKKERGESAGQRSVHSNYTQLETAKNEDPRFPGTLKTGLWARSRHPNLFFDLVTWTGFAIAGLNDYTISFLGFLGPIVLFLVMRFATIPITEKTMADTRPYYEEYKKNTNCFLPVF